MPPRKSDQRKSDASAARFSLKDPVDELTQPSPAPSAAVPHLDSQDSADKTPSTPSHEKKDKEKDKDKEKEKEKEKDAVSIDDLTLPKSIITRLAKGVLPANTQIQANAVLALSKSTTVFISYLASYANEHTVNAGKKTISPADVFKALEDTEFSFLKPRLEAEFDKFNAIQTEKRTSYRNKVKATKGDPDKSGVAAGDNSTLADDSINGKATAAGDDTDMADVTADLDKGDSSAPRTKKPRVDGAETEEEEEEEDAEDVDDEVEEDEPEQDEDEEEDEEDDDENDGGSGDETQDALEDKDNREDRDEALDGDDSD